MNNQSSHSVRHRIGFRFTQAVCGSATAIIGVVLVGLVGCGGEASMNAERSRFVLAEKPSDAGTIADAMEQAKTSEQSVDVTIVGRIGAGDQEPFADGQATFIMSEAPEGDHANDPGHDIDDCVFCKRQAAGGPVAFVRFLSDTGDVLAHDVRELFEIEKGKIVVIRGTATINERLEGLAVTADAIHVVN